MGVWAGSVTFLGADLVGQQRAELRADPSNEGVFQYARILTWPRSSSSTGIRWNPVGSTQGCAVLIEKRHNALAVDAAHLRLQPPSIRGAPHSELEHLTLDDMPLWAHSALLPGPGAEDLYGSRVDVCIVTRLS